MDGQFDPWQWYYAIPVVTRLYLTGAVGITCACFMDWISPLTLYYNYDLIFLRGQYWRILTSFLFFGSFSLDFLFHLYFVSRYCRLLEEGRFRGKAADFVYMLIFGIVLMVVMACTVDLFSKIRFLGHSLSFMMVYVWGRGRENANVRMSLLGLYNFNAPYLPWVLLAFSLCLGNPIETDFLGIIVGHLYYFLDHVYPQVAASRGWSCQKLLVTPLFLQYIFGSDDILRGINDTRVVDGAGIRLNENQNNAREQPQDDTINERNADGALNDIDGNNNINNHEHQD